jgi:hypothetical protein
MKLRSAPLDDLHLELQYQLSSDGRFLAHLVLSFSEAAHRVHHAVLMRLLRRNPPPCTYHYSELGREPFNPCRKGLEQV